MTNHVSENKRLLTQKSLHLKNKNSLKTEGIISLDQAKYIEKMKIRKKMEKQYEEDQNFFRKDSRNLDQTKEKQRPSTTSNIRKTDGNSNGYGKEYKINLNNKRLSNNLIDNKQNNGSNNSDTKNYIGKSYTQEVKNQIVNNQNHKSKSQLIRKAMGCTIL